MCNQIATTRLVIEETIEERSLCLVFVDFVRAFGTINHATLWTILEEAGISLKLISLSNFSSRSHLN